MQRFAMKLRFSGASVEQSGLDLYDGATSFYGFSQAIPIVVHAYMNNEVVSRGTALKGAKVYFGSPRRGSVIFDIITEIQRNPVSTEIGVGSSVAAAVFYDFIKYSFSKACGYLKVKPETSVVEKMRAIDEPFFDELAETLEGSLQRGHRAIDHGVRQITLERPRSELIAFNHRTSEWVHTRDENPEVQIFNGNVTRYNSITGNGRAYIRELRRILPFRPSDAFPEEDKWFLTWSLHGDNVDTKKELVFQASRIDSARGDPKRIILFGCKQA